ncbi:MAG: SDR family NAD(P)-dependent oxidoreductase [Mycobacteriaceae bacterium]
MRSRTSPVCLTKALVVGASGGIGSAITTTLTARKVTVATTYRSRPLSNQHTWQLDVTNFDQVRSVIAAVTKNLDGLDCLIYAAGPLIPMSHLSSIAPETYAQHLQIEATGFFAVVSAALPALRTSGGNVVAISTAATDRYPVRDGLSTGTKGAVDQLIRAFAAEEGRFGVRFNAVGPGMLTAGMAETLITSGQLDSAALTQARGNIALRRFGSAQDIAEAACFLASDAANYITGQKLNVDGGFSI